mmetsp:Transcript_40525/g.79288  ORF Transcript_40525/g.79288 Transcript_40525/m.79288 type:complete len:81 (+) Transcript_40525:3544-3786(+)
MSTAPVEGIEQAKYVAVGLPFVLSGPLLIRSRTQERLEDHAYCTVGMKGGGGHCIKQLFCSTCMAAGLGIPSFFASHVCS